LKITRVETIPVSVPLKQGLSTKTAGGQHVVSPYVMVRVHTDECLVGVGEATLSPRWSGETSPGCVAAIEGLIAPQLVGCDPTAVADLTARMNGTIRFNPFTKAAVEMALWDLAGKAAGVPVCQLLGGKVRDELPMKMVVGAFEVGEAVELARRFLKWGARCLKVKVGLDADQDVERVRAVRQLAGADIPIGIDANQGWDLATARRALARLEMADESIFTLTDARRITALGAADVLSVYPGKHGGIAATREIVQVGRAAGIVSSMGSNLELGVATAAMLHVGAAEQAIDSERYPGDFLGPLYHESDLLTEPLELGPEVARLPRGPGLGVELDEEQLELYRDTSRQAAPLGEPCGG